MTQFSSFVSCVTEALRSLGYFFEYLRNNTRTYKSYGSATTHLSESYLIFHCMKGNVLEEGNRKVLTFKEDLKVCVFWSRKNKYHNEVASCKELVYVLSVYFSMVFMAFSRHTSFGNPFGMYFFDYFHVRTF